jgi:hypothetical protein
MVASVKNIIAHKTQCEMFVTDVEVGYNKNLLIK